MGMKIQRAHIIGSVVLLAGAWGAGGCASGAQRDASGVLSAGDPDPGMAIDAQQSSLAFDAARETLMEYRFALDRVDARRGVITTRPKRTAGLASPWDREQSGMDQEWEDLLNEQRRVVRVDFEQSPEGDGFVGFSVRVEVLRTHRPNWRVQTESVRLSTHARSRDSAGELEPQSQSEVIALDVRLAQRLTDEIGQRISSAAVEQ